MDTSGAATIRVVLVVVALIGVASLTYPVEDLLTDAYGTSARELGGIHKIKHVIVVMQENRSFDNYFGTFPGADGIPTRDGRPTACLPDSRVGNCVRPFHDSNLIDAGGPHTAGAAQIDIHGGRMDGFVRMALLGRGRHCRHNSDAPGCTSKLSTSPIPDVIGWHDAREIPNYWRYAHRFVLQDHMFAGVRSWSLPAHLDMVSG